MTRQQFEESIASLLQRKQANIQEAKQLNKELIELRQAYEAPSLDDMVGTEGYPPSIKDGVVIEQQAIGGYFINRNEPTEPQGAVKRD